VNPDDMPDFRVGNLTNEDAIKEAENKEYRRHKAIKRNEEIMEKKEKEDAENKEEEKKNNGFSGRT